jgi:hypothetical protein
MIASGSSRSRSEPCSSAPRYRAISGCWRHTFSGHPRRACPCTSSSALGVTYKTAWFMMHRIREAMRVEGSDVPPIGGSGKTVEAMKPISARRPTRRRRVTAVAAPTSRAASARPASARSSSLSSEAAQSVSFHVAGANKETVVDVLRDNLDRESRLHRRRPTV